LLIEESRTNLLTYSDYSQVAGTTDAQLEGVVAAPDGTITARRYSVPSAGLDAINKITSAGTAGKDYTFSVWVRSTGTASEVRLSVGDPDVITIIQISTQWQRFEITKINNASNFVRAYVQLLNVGDEVEVFGAQLEEGSFPTSYVPTTTSAVTRAADVASITGTNFSSWYNQSEGTVFVAVDKANEPNTVAASFDDGTAANRIELRSSGSDVDNSRFDIVENSAGLYSQQPSNAGTAVLRLALAYKVGSVNNAVNGAVGTVAAPASIPNVSRLFLYNSVFSTDLRPGHIARLAYYPYRLADATLQEITS
jgi:hypothetical protein